MPTKNYKDEPRMGKKRPLRPYNYKHHLFRMKPCTNPFGFYLRKTRISKGLSIHAFEIDYGMERDTLNEYELCDYPRNDVTKARIANGLDITLEELEARIDEAKYFVSNATEDEYEDFIEMQRAERKEVSTERINRVRPKWFGRKIFGNPNSGFNNYKGPMTSFEFAIPQPITVYMDILMRDRGCTAGDILRKALDLLAQVECWPVDLATHELNEKRVNKVPLVREEKPDDLSDIYFSEEDDLVDRLDEWELN